MSMNQWFPMLHQITVRKPQDKVTGVDYMQSVWVGLTASLINMPRILWNILWYGNMSSLIQFFVLMLLIAPILGFLGELKTKDISFEEAREFFFKRK